MANRESLRGAAVKTRVLVVDDSPLIRAVLGESFAATTDIEVVGEAGTATETFAVIERTRPDLVVLDLGLPDKSGIEVTAEIRAARPALTISWAIISAKNVSILYGRQRIDQR